MLHITINTLIIHNNKSNLLNIIIHALNTCANYCHFTVKHVIKQTSILCKTCLNFV